MSRQANGTADLSRLRPHEPDEIRFGKRQFKDALGVDYAVLTSVWET